MKKIIIGLLLSLLMFPGVKAGLVDFELNNSEDELYTHIFTTPIKYTSNINTLDCGALGKRALSFTPDKSFYYSYSNNHWLFGLYSSTLNKVGLCGYMGSVGHGIDEKTGFGLDTNFSENAVLMSYNIKPSSPKFTHFPSYGPGRLSYSADLTQTKIFESNSQNISLHSLNGPQIPDGAICQDISRPKFIFKRHLIGNPSQLIEKDDKITLSSDSISISFKNGKSYSGSLNNLINGSGSFSFTKPFWSTPGMIQSRVSHGNGINYFKLDGSGEFNKKFGTSVGTIGGTSSPVATSPYDNFFLVGICGGGRLLNPLLENSPQLNGKGVYFFKMDEKYTLPNKYDCLEFDFKLSSLKSATLNDFELGIKSQSGTIVSELCQTETETFVNGESYTGSIDEIGKDSLEIGKMNTSPLFNFDEGLDNQKNYDTNQDGVISDEEMKGGVIGWLDGILNIFKDFIQGISNTAESIKNFFNAFLDFGNVEQQNLYSWFIPSTYAENKLGEAFSQSADNFSKSNNFMTKTLNFMKWVFISTLFIMILYSITHGKND